MNLNFIFYLTAVFFSVQFVGFVVFPRTLRDFVQFAQTEGGVLAVNDTWLRVCSTVQTGNAEPASVKQTIRRTVMCSAIPCQNTSFPVTAMPTCRPTWKTTVTRFPAFYNVKSNHARKFVDTLFFCT